MNALNSLTAEDFALRLMDLFGEFPGIVYRLKVVGETFTPVWVSPNFSKVTGFEIGKTIGDANWWPSHLHPEDCDRTFTSVSKIFEGQPVSQEYRFQFADGQYHWIHDELRVERRDQRGNITHLVGSWSDVTQQREAQISATKKIEERFTTLVENASDAIFILNRDGAILEANKAACELTGYTAEELLELNVARLNMNTAPDGPCADWNPGGAAPEDFPLDMECSCRRKDGSKFSGDIRVNLLPSDAEDKLFVAMVRDISQRKEIESELAGKVAELDFQKAALDEHAIVSITDTKGTITYVNDKFCAISGFERSELIGENHRIVKSDRHDQEFYEDLWTTIASGKTWRGQIMNEKKGGGFYWVDATIVPFLDDEGKPFQFVAIRTDITERVRAEEAADAANLAKSEFLSSMSHELRTPLNAILGFSQLLMTDNDMPLTAIQNKAVNHIRGAGEHLLELINQVLDLAKIESGAISLTLENLPPSDVITECGAMVDAMIAGKQISFEDRALATVAPDIHADAIRLKQVLLNLLSNAVKYNRPNGSVFLDIQRVEKGFLRFIVSDTGRGIPEEHKSRVFDPFERLGAEGGEVEGTGIGLAITRQLVLAMGGRIGFESRVGEGSEFWIDIPLANTEGCLKSQATRPVDNSASRISKLAPPKESDARKLLYIEDNPANLELVTMMVKRIPNLVLIPAHNAEIGLDIACSKKPDIIFMDINLPGMDGVVALEKLRQDRRTANIPVIAVTAAAMPADIQRGVEAGFKRYLTKPLEMPEVLETIETHLAN